MQPIRIAGIGASAVGGSSGLRVRQGVRIAGTGSSAVGGSAALESFPTPDALSIAGFSATGTVHLLMRITAGQYERGNGQVNLWASDLWTQDGAAGQVGILEEGSPTISGITGNAPTIRRLAKWDSLSRLILNSQDGNLGEIFDEASDPSVTLVMETTGGREMFTAAAPSSRRNASFADWRGSDGDLTDAMYALLDGILPGREVILAIHQGVASYAPPPDEIRIAGIGSSTVTGATALETVEPPAARIAGIGSSAVTAASALAVEEPGAARLAGIGSSAVTSVSGLARIEPAAARLAGIGSSLVTAVSGLGVMETRHPIAGVGHSLVSAVSGLARVEPPAARLAGVGSSAVAGAAGLSRFAAMARIAGVGSSAVASASALAVIQPGATRIAGIGSSTVSAVSGLHRMVNRRAIAGIGSSAVTAVSGLSRVEPAGARIAGLGESAVAGASSLSRRVILSTTLNLRAQDFQSRANRISWNIPSGERLPVDPLFWPGAEERWFARLSLFDDGQVEFRFTSSNAEFSGDTGDDLVAAWEDGGSFSLEAGGQSLTVQMTGLDLSEPYVFTPSNSDQVIAVENALDGNGDGSLGGTLTLRYLAVPPARIAGIGSAAVAGTSSLAVEEPGAVRIGGVGQSAVSAASALTVREARMAISGIGNSPVASVSGLTRQEPAAARLAGIGASPVAAATGLARLAPTARIAGWAQAPSPRNRACWCSRHRRAGSRKPISATRTSTPVSCFGKTWKFWSIPD